MLRLPFAPWRLGAIRRSAPTCGRVRYGALGYSAEKIRARRDRPSARGRRCAGSGALGVEAGSRRPGHAKPGAAVRSDPGADGAVASSCPPGSRADQAEAATGPVQLRRFAPATGVPVAGELAPDSPAILTMPPDERPRSLAGDGLRAPRCAPARCDEPVDLSVVVPVLNEREALPALLDEIERRLLGARGRVGGDRRRRRLDRRHLRAGRAARPPTDRGCAAIRLRRNFGKSAALATGFAHSDGRADRHHRRRRAGRSRRTSRACSSASSRAPTSSRAGSATAATRSRGRLASRCVQPGHLALGGPRDARHELRPEGLPRRVRALARDLRRAAPLHPGARRPAGMAGGRDAGQPPPAAATAARGSAPSATCAARWTCSPSPSSAATSTGPLHLFGGIGLALTAGRARDLALPDDPEDQRRGDRPAAAALPRRAADRRRHPAPHPRAARPDAGAGRGEIAAGRSARTRRADRAGFRRASGRRTARDQPRKRPAPR